MKPPPPPTVGKMRACLLTLPRAPISEAETDPHAANAQVSLCRALTLINPCDRGDRKMTKSCFRARVFRAVCIDGPQRAGRSLGDNGECPLPRHSGVHSLGWKV